MSELLTNRLKDFALKVDARIDELKARTTTLEQNSGSTAPKLHVGNTPPADLTSVWIDTN